MTDRTRDYWEAMVGTRQSYNVEDRRRERRIGVTPQDERYDRFRDARYTLQRNAESAAMAPQETQALLTMLTDLLHKGEDPAEVMNTDISINRLNKLRIDKVSRERARALGLGAVVDRAEAAAADYIARGRTAPIQESQGMLDVLDAAQAEIEARLAQDDMAAASAATQAGIAGMTPTPTPIDPKLSKAYADVVWRSALEIQLDADEQAMGRRISEDMLRHEQQRGALDRANIARVAGATDDKRTAQQEFRAATEEGRRRDDPLLRTWRRRLPSGRTITVYRQKFWR